VRLLKAVVSEHIVRKPQYLAYYDWITDFYHTLHAKEREWIGEVYDERYALVQHVAPAAIGKLPKDQKDLLFARVTWLAEKGRLLGVDQEKMKHLEKLRKALPPQASEQLPAA
jgi:hypothetical protein